jgi:hypothetical protein
MNDDAYPKPMSARRIWLARGIAVAADFVQIAVFPYSVEGLLSPLNAILDVVCLLLILLVGGHIVFLPTFIIEQLPFADLAPTWTLAALIATRRKHLATESSESRRSIPMKLRYNDGDDREEANAGV